MSSSPDTVNSVEIDVVDQPTKSVTFSLTKATVIREIKDVQLQPRANEIIVSGLDPKLDPDSVRVDGYGSATITNIQTDVVPRKTRFVDVHPVDDDSDQSDSDQDELDDERGPGRVAIDAAKAELLDAETELASSKDARATSIKMLEFLDQYGKTMQAQDVEVSKMTEFLHVYRQQRAAESIRHQQSSTEIAIMEKKVENAYQKLAHAEKAFAKKKKAATREIRQQKEKKAHEKQQKRLEKLRALEQRRKFWTANVGQVVIHLDGPSVYTPGSSRRGSVVSYDEKDSPPDRETANLILTYVVPNASWVPRYELRISTPTSSAKLVYRAEFGNSTAETWKDANLTFSTSQTSFSGLEEKIPRLDPWNIKLAKALGFDTEDKIWASGLHSQKEMSSNNPLPRNKSISPLFGVGSQGGVVQANKVSGGSLFGQSSNNTVSNTSGGLAPANTSSAFGSSGGFGPSANAPSGFGSSVGGFGGTGYTRMNQAGPTALFGGTAQGKAPDLPQVQSEAEQAVNPADEDHGGDDDAATLSPEFNALGHQDSQRQNYGLTTSYELSGKRTITPSSVKRRHVITELDLKSVTISHVLVPKLRCAAFLKARVKNTTTTSLLRGKAGMTVDGTFLGSISLPNCEPDNFVDLSLGVDPSIQVTYAKPTVRRATSGFFTKDDSAIFTRTCWIKNTKKTTASITVLDQVPVSEDERLRVNILEPKGLAEENDVTKLDALFDKGEKGKGQIHLLKNGLVKWVLEIRPGKDVKLVLEYESRIPSGQKIIGLQ
ncbi:uncharacterized protein TRUGW13939_08420 [Talaromyces rugulosus]|uniref:DUF4139 domain-containing protein n=1 Tax=Talaromyces rugulosus TaxID=121627 RepID=A0A7H8R4J7_TALRU|nr:uncharacterized protein TRUGW13939_08420 [Talaromyces rugulosus]QKX61272.1 hypothetical protein TRUGW13939_08420 [Talaromyces rugulosus]